MIKAELFNLVRGHTTIYIRIFIPDLLINFHVNMPVRAYEINFNFKINRKPRIKYNLISASLIKLTYVL